MRLTILSYLRIEEREGAEALAEVSARRLLQTHA